MSATLPGDTPPRAGRRPYDLHPGASPQWTAGPPTDGPRLPAQAGPGDRHPLGRVAALITGVLLVVLGLLPLGVGGGLLTIDLADRHDGYLTLAASDYHTDGSALTTDPVTLWAQGHTWYQASLLGDVRVSATAADPHTRLFIGIAPADSAQAYLAGVHHSTLTHLTGGRETTAEHPGTALAAAPTGVPIWTAAVSGLGTQTFTWPSRDGTWALVVMNADGSSPVDARVDVGVTAPSLAWISASLLGVGLLILVAGVLLIAIVARRAARERATSRPVVSRR